MIIRNISDQNPSGDKTTVKGDNKNNKNTNTAKKADNTKKNQPKTGDNSHVMFYLFMIEAQWLQHSLL